MADSRESVGASPASTEDKEWYARVDGSYQLGYGPWSSIKFGYRYAQHDRDTHQVAQGPNFALDPFNPANLPRWNGETSSFGWIGVSIGISK